MSTPAPPPRPLLKVERLLAQGAHSFVLLATTPEGERLAVKQTALALSACPPQEAAALQARITELIQGLRHPQVVEWRYYTQDAERARLAHVYQEGVTLQEFVEAPRTAFPLTEIVGWMKQMAELVGWFHEKGMVMPPGDLKPSHFVLDEWEKVFLLDLDLRFLAGGEAAAPDAARMASFQPWLAPEVARAAGGRGADVRSDIYCLGAVFHALLTHGAPPDSLRRACGEETLAAPHRLNPQVPAALGELVESMLAVMPEERPPDTREVAKNLRNISRNLRRDGSSQQSHMRRCPECRLRIARMAAQCRYCALPPPTVKAITMGGPSPAGLEAPPAQSPPRRTALLASLAAVTVIGLVAAGIWCSSHSSSPEGPVPRSPRPGVKRGGAESPRRATPSPAKRSTAPR